MTQMTGGQALALSIRNEGVRTLFGLPGIQLDWAFDALWELQDDLKVIHPRHEQACSYMADGFARASGEVGSFLVVPGPGILNASAGLATAFACSSPVLAITGQIQSDQIGLGRGALHEINNQLDTLASLTKRAERASSPEEIPGVVHRAFRELHVGRPRPVGIEVPPDVLEARSDVTLQEPGGFNRMEADPEQIEQSARMLGEAERPIIVSGGGVLSSGAWEELSALAETLDAPVFMTGNGRGAISDREPRAHSGWGALAALQADADVVLAVGTRYNISPRAQVDLPRGQRFIQIDIDGEEIGRNRQPDASVLADAKDALGRLANRVPGHNRNRDSRERDFAALKKRTAETMARLEVQQAFGMALREAMPDDAILVNESTQVGYWAQGGGFPVYEPRTFLTSGYQGTLGYGFPTALGAQVGRPDARVVSISGDGGFLYNVQELSTAARHGIPVIAVVFNDDAYGNVRRIQQLRFNEHTIASDLLNPDLPKLAETFGIAGMRAKTPPELKRCVETALSSNVPSLIEVPMPATVDLPSPFPMEPAPPRPVLAL